MVFTIRSKTVAPSIEAIDRTIAEAPVSAELKILLATCKPTKAPAIPTTMFLDKSSMPSVGVLALVANPSTVPVTIVMMIIIITGLILG
jgi:hypothetical protein